MWSTKWEFFFATTVLHAHNSYLALVRGETIYSSLSRTSSIDVVRLLKGNGIFFLTFLPAYVIAYDCYGESLRTE